MASSASYKILHWDFSIQIDKTARFSVQTHDAIPFSRWRTLSMMGLMSPRFRSSAKSLRRPATNSALNDRLRLRSVEPIRLALLRSRTPRLAFSATAPAQTALEDQSTVHTDMTRNAHSTPSAFVCLTLEACKACFAYVQAHSTIPKHGEFSKPNWNSEHAG